MAVKKAVAEAAKEVAAESKDFALKVNADFDGEMDPLLVKWAKSPVSGWIACGFGVALLVIGAVLARILG